MKAFNDICLCCALLLGIRAPANASDSASTTPNGTPIQAPQAAPQKAAAEPLPPYDYPFTNGMYASAAGYLSTKHVCLPCQKTVLLDVPGICDKFPVSAVIQESSAPLVVILLGIDGHPDEDFSRLWASWYAEAGYHVLSFESTFTQDFNARSHRGVIGNMWLESELAAKIVAAFVSQSCDNGRVSKIGVVGMSYGGIEALMLGTFAADKKLPFEVAAIQAYSPPISLQHSAAIVDGWYAETYGKYTLVELLALRKHVPNRDCPDSPICESMLKAAGAANFRLPLPALIAYSDKAYCLNQLPKGDEFDDAYVRADHAARWTFMKFAYGMSYPYWMRTLNAPNLDLLVNAANLNALLARQPSGSEIILAEDDPLDSAADMQSFKAQSAGKPVTLLPHGGHLGYINEPWTRAKLLTLFK